MKTENKLLARQTLNQKGLVNMMESNSELIFCANYEFFPRMAHILTNVIQFYKIASFL